MDTEVTLPLALILLAVLGACLVAAAALPMGRKFPKPSPEAGRIGERRVIGVVSRTGLPALHDIYLRTSGGATQIDHVVRAGRTLFILETKHYSGACFGRPGERTWTQVSRGAKRRFYNPLLQNDGHVAAVRRAAGWGCRLRPLVVFTGSATFPAGMPAGVVDLPELDRLLARAARWRLPSLRGAVAWRRLQRRAETAGTAAGAHRRSLKRAKVGR
ncbi:nuclease-related domain-containing protein [Methylobacterium sp. 092160098-2]|uniref:nuclease-related domain-containing protein n=1 Tax=Methylobacterium sp. 092160098-2 TaxID=3025129 RepID=UPI002381A535|nr:nuclease-related domain-containing protein [Methylobacterium sp. 092160098-2]MDE4914873.1 nuclease-related domain-containing protein [Methylobacterium sp. 092160098-2]